MTRLALVLALFAACGDNSNEDRPDGGGSNVDAPIDMEIPAPPRAVVVAGDFSATGVLSALDLETRAATTNAAPATAIGGDPILRKYGSDLLVVNRVENNITILSASDYSLVEQLGTGAGSNPQDVAVDGNKVFVATYARKGLIEMTRGSAAIIDIDLSADDPDGKPNCASVYKVGTKLFVTCQILDDANTFASRGINGKVYIVDIATRAITGVVTLTTLNPFSLLEQMPNGDLVVGTVNFLDNNAGCIERITTSGTPAASCYINNTMLAGGFASRLAVNTSKLFVLVPRADFSGGDVRTIDVGTGALDSAAYSKNTQALGDVVTCPNGNVVVAEAPPPPTSSPQGLRVYTASQTEVTTEAVTVGLKPTSSHGLVCY